MRGLSFSYPNPKGLYYVMKTNPDAPNNYVVCTARVFSAVRNQAISAALTHFEEFALL
jgi:hypothetical protein